MGITITQKHFEPVRFSFKKEEDFQIENKEGLSFSFGLSPKNNATITNFIIDITSETINRNTDVILQFKTRSTFQLSGFNETPHLAVLEDLVYESYGNHRSLFRFQVSTIDFLKHRTIAAIRPELFEATLQKEFLNSFPDN